MNKPVLTKTIFNDSNLVTHSFDVNFNKEKFINRFIDTVNKHFKKGYKIIENRREYIGEFQSPMIDSSLYKIKIENKKQTSIIIFIFNFENNKWKFDEIYFKELDPSELL